MQPAEIPLFSVILPTFNRAAMLERAVRSVRQQHFQDWELLVVDDGSTDDTAGVVTAFSDSRIRYLPGSHRGRSEARNRGLAQCKGRYVCFLDDDDLYLPDHLGCFAEYLRLQGFPKVILRSGMKSTGLGRCREYPLYRKKRPGAHPLRFFLFHTCSPGTLCIPREFADGLGFTEGLDDWEDTEWIIRLFARYPMVQLERATYIYVKHEAMGSLTAYRDGAAMLRQLTGVEAVMDNLLEDKLIRRLISRRYRFRWLAKQYLLYAAQAWEFLGAREAKKVYCEALRRGLWWYAGVGMVRMFWKIWFCSSPISSGVEGSAAAKQQKEVL